MVGPAEVNAEWKKKQWLRKGDIYIYIYIYLKGDIYIYLKDKSKDSRPTNMQQHSIR